MEMKIPNVRQTPNPTLPNFKFLELGFEISLALGVWGWGFLPEGTA
jgi:hypothetical protein